MKCSFTKYPNNYVKANSDKSGKQSELDQSFNVKFDSGYVDSAIAMAKSQLRDASEHFINDDGDDCFAIYEDDAIKVVTAILESLKKDL